MDTKKAKVFPDGPWGPEDHIQRGAITYDFMVPGDPLTPGWASVPGAKRIRIDQAVSLPKIMALPLSWHDAKPLLENMGGPVAPETGKAVLPFQYHLGGEASTRASEDRDQTMPSSPTTSSKAAFAAPNCPTNGSSWAITATPGSSVASIPAAAPHP